jgi:hypothetical protein
MGKRFKFVTLDNPKIDDPTRQENGTVKVEFRLEKKKAIQIYQPPAWNYPKWRYQGMWKISYNDCYGTVLCSNGAMSGATIAGSESNQRFYEVDFDAENSVTTLTLKIMGV